MNTTEDWMPYPVPEGDPKHDIGDEARAAIIQRLEPILRGEMEPEKARQMAMFCAASVRGLLYELGVLRDMAECSEYLKDGETPAQCLARNRADIDALMSLLAAAKQKPASTQCTTCGASLPSSQTPRGNDHD